MKNLILGALLLLSTFTNAAIVYTNMNDAVIISGGSFNIDIDGNGINNYKQMLIGISYIYDIIGN